MKFILTVLSAMLLSAVSHADETARIQAFSEESISNLVVQVDQWLINKEIDRYALLLADDLTVTLVYPPDVDLEPLVYNREDYLQQIHESLGELSIHKLQTTIHRIDISSDGLSARVFTSAIQISAPDTDGNVIRMTMSGDTFLIIRKGKPFITKTTSTLTGYSVE